MKKIKEMFKKVKEKLVSLKDKIKEFFVKHEDTFAAIGIAISHVVWTLVGYRVGSIVTSIEENRDFAKRLPGIIDNSGYLGQVATLQWMDNYVPEASKICDDYYDAHKNDPGFKYVGDIFYENPMVKGVTNYLKEVIDK